MEMQHKGDPAAVRKFLDAVGDEEVCGESLAEAVRGGLDIAWLTGQYLEASKPREES